MNRITVLGIDLAKHHFQLHGSESNGKRVLKKTLSPEKATAFIANLAPCVIGMEACGGSHFWARRFRGMGHEVRLIPPQYVRAFVIGNHNDVKDAEAISVAAQRQGIRFVPIKSEEQQSVQFIHRIRQRLVKNKVELTNEVRGVLYECGLKIRQGDKAFREVLANVRSYEQISPRLATELSIAFEEFLELEKQIASKDKLLEEIAKSDDRCRNLMTIPGVGPMTATATVAAVGNAQEFQSGRGMAAWLGIVPGHHHTGGPTRKVVMKGITKRGDRYLRKLFIQGARAWLLHLSHYSCKRAQWAKKLIEKKGFNKTAVALAHKNIRIACILLQRNETYLAA
jgi:transposase